MDCQIDERILQEDCYFLFWSHTHTHTIAKLAFREQSLHFYGLRTDDMFSCYRLLIIIRLIAVLVFFAWRIRHNKSDIMWFWTMSIVGDVWFGFSWLLNQLPKFNPVKTIPDLPALKRHFGFPDGTSRLPGIDVFVTTADPIDEPILYTMNCVLSILAVNYPVDRLACYLSDDSGALVLYEALVEVGKFAPLWVPFCRKYSIEPRAPESYFEHVAPPQAGRVTQDVTASQGIGVSGGWPWNEPSARNWRRRDRRLLPG